MVIHSLYSKNKVSLFTCLNYNVHTQCTDASRYQFFNFCSQEAAMGRRSAHSSYKRNTDNLELLGFHCCSSIQFHLPLFLSQTGKIDVNHTWLSTRIKISKEFKNIVHHVHQMMIESTKQLIIAKILTLEQILTFNEKNIYSFQPRAS